MEIKEIFKNMLYCPDCKEKLHRTRAKDFDGENGLYCPECDAKLLHLATIEGDTDERPEEKRDIRGN